MRAIIQRVSEASITIENTLKSHINQGLLVLIGIETDDTQEDIYWLSKKIIKMRIFNDDSGVMNRSVKEIGGELLIVSQFTLHASTKKGNRPSYMKAAKPDIAIPLYQSFLTYTEQLLEKSVKKGVFGADMKVNLINDGPVTILMDSKKKE